MTRTANEAHPYTDRQGRNLCDRCDRYAGDPRAAEMFGLEAAELTPAQWVEFGIRLAARHPLP